VSQPRIAVFARLANGAVKPTRIIAGQGTRLGRTIHGIGYNPLRDEIITVNPLAAAILAFRGAAEGEEAPLRVIQGTNTHLILPHAVSLDPQNKEIIVGDRESQVVVFSDTADGNPAPLRLLRGPKTKLAFVVGTAVDPERNLLFVANTGPGATGILIFNRTDSGDVAPRGMLSGPKTGLTYPWEVRVFGDKLFVAGTNSSYRMPYDRGELHPRTDLTSVPQSPWSSDTLGFIGVWNITDCGDVPPRAIIKGAVSGLIHPTGVVLDPVHGEIYASDSVRNGIFTYLIPDLFKPAPGP